MLVDLMKTEHFWCYPCCVLQRFLPKANPDDSLVCYMEHSLPQTYEWWWFADSTLQYFKTAVLEIQKFLFSFAHIFGNLDEKLPHENICTGIHLGKWAPEPNHETSINGGGTRVIFGRAGRLCAYWSYCTEPKPDLCEAVKFHTSSW